MDNILLVAKVKKFPGSGWAIGGPARVKSFGLPVGQWGIRGGVGLVVLGGR